MSTYRIPRNGKFSQPNKGDISGNLVKTLNVDLRTNPGRLRISPRMTVITKDNDSSISNFGLPIGFVTHILSSAEIMLMAAGSGGSGNAGTGKIFKNSAIGFGAFTNLSGTDATNQPTTISDCYSDIISWSGKESTTFPRSYVSTFAGGTPDIAQLSGQTWTSAWFTSTRSGSGLTTYSPVNLCPAFNGNLYIINNQQISYAPITGNIVSPSSTTDPNTTQGTIHTLGKYQLLWGMSSSNRVWVGMMERSSGSTSHRGGCIGEWNTDGTAFNKIYKVDAPSVLAGIVRNDTPFVFDAFGVLRKFVGEAGFAEVARLPVANLNIEMPGIYDPFTNTRWVHTRGMEIVNGKIRVNVNNFVSTGVYVDSMPSGLWDFDPDEPEKGFIHVNSPCADSNDFGQQALEGVGALYPLKVTGGSFLVGASYYTDDATTNRKAVFYDDITTNSSKRGSFTLPFISSDQIQDTWQRTSVRNSALPSGDKIIGKYRTAKSSNFPFIASAIWTSSTTFTSTSANFANVSGGEEIEGVMGKSASTTAHVSSISVNGGTYTVTIDEAIGQSSGTFKVKVDNFKRMSEISTTGDTEGDLPISGAATKIQPKFEVRATGDLEVEDVTLISTGHKLLK